MSDAIKIIKDELERIESDCLEDRDSARYCIKQLTKALSVAVESLKHYDHQKIKATKTPCGTGELHPLATDALTTIANILSGNDGK